MALTKFKPDNDGFRGIATSPEMRDVLREIAEKAKTIAEGLAQDFRVTGDYVDSFTITEDTIEWNGEYPGPRAAASLVNTSDHAAAVEWGNGHSHKTHRVLGRTLDMLGRF